MCSCVCVFVDVFVIGHGGYQDNKNTNSFYLNIYRQFHAATRPAPLRQRCRKQRKRTSGWYFFFYAFLKFFIYLGSPHISQLASSLRLINVQCEHVHDSLAAASMLSG